MAASPVRVIVTGATGMVGEGVVHECLISNEVEAVLVVSRKTTGIKHPKLKELLLPDFFDLSSVQSQMAGYNACFFCLGVSSVGISQETYERLTFQLTMGFATVVAAQNPGMVFCYVSGKGTDSSEKGRMHWARVKGKTENDLQKLPFRSVYCFRPGIMSPTPGLKNTLSLYKWLGWLLPLMRTVSPNSINSLAEVGHAMIHVVTRGYHQKIIEVADIRKLAKLR
jgi:hypothetical protein